MLVTSAEKYITDPSYQFVRTIEPYDFEGDVWDFVVCMPENELLAAGTEKQYKTMLDDIESILDSFTPIGSAR